MLLNTLPQSEILGVEVVHESIPERIQARKANSEKDIWLFGGANLFRYLLDQGLVDRVEVSVILSCLVVAFD